MNIQQINEKSFRKFSTQKRTFFRKNVTLLRSTVIRHIFSVQAHDSRYKFFQKSGTVVLQSWYWLMSTEIYFEQNREIFKFFFRKYWESMLEKYNF